MEFTGSVDIEAPRQAVWDLLLDFDRLATCGPGVESIEHEDATHARVRAKVGVGFMTLGFNIDLELIEAVAPDRAIIRATGAAPGTSVDASGSMHLSGPPDGPTRMDYAATVELFGALAGVGSRMIEGTAAKLIDQTFDCVRAQLAPAA
ncbi:MAG TPA: carbon monoxide dehydrogenase subunit G [Candidatus Limnocylindrales bacterium]|nr:carbon monoxide dehydrogenase subunit G [Candidatus Limnocylindrales bacterium]